MAIFIRYMGFIYIGYKKGSIMGNNISTFNVKNINSRIHTPSVNVGRRNVENRYNFQASCKASTYLATAQPQIVIAQPQSGSCPMGFGQKIVQILRKFGVGTSVASGNSMPMRSGCGMFNSGMGNCMSMQGSLFRNRFMC